LRHGELEDFREAPLGSSLRWRRRHRRTQRRGGEAAGAARTRRGCGREVSGGPWEAAGAANPLSLAHVRALPPCAGATPPSSPPQRQVGRELEQLAAAGAGAAVEGRVRVQPAQREGDGIALARARAERGRGRVYPDS